MHHPPPSIQYTQKVRHNPKACCLCRRGLLVSKSDRLMRPSFLFSHLVKTAQTLILTPLSLLPFSIPNRHTGHTAQASSGKRALCVPYTVTHPPRANRGLPGPKQPIDPIPCPSRRETVDAVQHRCARRVTFPPAGLTSVPRRGTLEQAPTGVQRETREATGSCRSAVRGLPQQCGYRGAPVAGVPHKEGAFSSPRGDPARGIAGTRFLGNGDAFDGTFMALEGGYRPSALWRPHDDLFEYVLAAQMQGGGGGAGERGAIGSRRRRAVIRTYQRIPHHPIMLRVAASRRLEGGGGGT